jgi:hypothetical protein
MFNQKVKEIKKSAPEVLNPRFRDPGKLSSEQLSDPDYALKLLEKQNGGKLSITCTKCHHCR